VFPNAPLNNECRATAWFTPTSFSPAPRRSASTTEGEGAGKKEEEEEEEEVDPNSKAEMLESVRYINDLVEKEIERGVKAERIVVGGFSQGGAIALLVGLGLGLSSSSEQRKLGGVAGLSGFLPFVTHGMAGIEEARKRRINIFLAHGRKDMMVPVRISFLLLCF